MFVTLQATMMLLAGIGLVNYYRAVLPGLAELAYPLYQLTKAKLVEKKLPSGKTKKKRVYVKFTWTTQHSNAWEKCRELVECNILLVYPHPT